ncbi:sensor histidine kinase [Streptomyces sp. KMM 9044]|uniref:sensor histidine kinase n=1 Tax=Streptomyces sp. KMM 9044 TaxID=2744474 RepID=UPI002151E626|nr:histidine kinase [Streptomyces sp. KMM 9044]WAX78221.1 histidine kinase [Streptomyces sp. KMM 9044]
MAMTGERRPRSGHRGRRGLLRRCRTRRPGTGVPSADGSPLPEPAVPEATDRATPQAPASPPPPEPVPAFESPAVGLQINALQALCRQVFGFRLAVIALAAPAALRNAGPGWGVRLVGIAVVGTFMASYVLVRDWERFGPFLLRHPALLAVDTLFGALLLISAGPDSLLAYAGVCTPLLAGLVYGRRGAAAFASLQGLILLLVRGTLADAAPPAGLTETLFLPGLCVVTGAVGSSLRDLMLRFGTAARALTAVQTRLAATEAVSEERTRLAREMHDSVAKTLYGVALAADGLAGSASAGHVNAALVRQQAELVARSARRAAAESRELLADLRGGRPGDAGAWQGDKEIVSELAARTSNFSTRTGLPATFRRTSDDDGAGTPPRPVRVPLTVARQLLSIVSEAMENAHRHAHPTRVAVSAGVHGGLLRITVHDDGRGLPPGTTLEQLRRDGRFGLVGMVERAAAIGARIRIGRGAHPRGTEVRLELPTAPARPLISTRATAEAAR